MHHIKEEGLSRCARAACERLGAGATLHNDNGLINNKIGLKIHLNILMI